LLVYVESVPAAVMAPEMEMLAAVIAPAMVGPAAATEVARPAAAAWVELLATTGYLLKGWLVRW
jgi:hypothetical protein